MKKTDVFTELVIYQIYPRSFYDTNSDGIGDLNGITEKVGYFKELGVNAVWLCPCYKSPNVDNGYDISDYRDIMDDFGTFADWKRMVKTLHENGIKVIMDLVPNHTSDKHKWFVESRKSKDNEYSDYYYWFDKPPNGWKSAFGGSAWEYVPERGQYYLHSYAEGQPDLNWDNPKVRKEICDVIDFWVDNGVDGFRIDVIDQISKNIHGENYFGPDLHKYIREMFGREKTAGLFTVGECWAEDIEEFVRHCGRKRNELKSLFQFDHINKGRIDRFTPAPFTLKEITDRLSFWQKQTISRGVPYVLFTDNHDNSRFLSRYGNDRELRYESAAMFAGMIYLLRGIPIIYQGQEFGVTNSHHNSFSDFRDVENVWFYEKNKDKIPERELFERLNFGSRDNARRPMPWNGGKNGGFTEGTSWIPLYSRYKEINLENDKTSQKSVFEFYKELLRFRKKTAAILYGDFEEITADNQNCFVYKRSFENETYVVVCNFESRNDINIYGLNGKLSFGNYFRENRNLSGVYEPYELAVYKVL